MKTACGARPERGRVSRASLLPLSAVGPSGIDDAPWKRSVLDASLWRPEATHID